MLTKEVHQEIGRVYVAAAAEKRIVKAPAEPEHVYYTIDEDGRMDRCEAEPHPAAHKAYDLPTVARVVAESMKPFELGSWEPVATLRKPKPAVFYSREGVVGVLDAHVRRDRVSLDLPQSEPFAKLAEWDGSKGVTLSHLEIYTLTRTLFRDHLTAHPDLKTQVAKVDIKKAQEAVAEVSRRGVSMSRSMMAEASGADKLPEVLTFDVPVFESPMFPVTANVRCAFDLDAQTERFRVVPLPGEIEKAFVQAERFIAARLADALKQAGAEAVPVYYGEP